MTDAILFMHTNITVTVIRDDIYQIRIEDLTDEELHDLLKRGTPTQLRAYCSLPVGSIREQISRENAAPLVSEIAKCVENKR